MKSLVQRIVAFLKSEQFLTFLLTIVVAGIFVYLWQVHRTLGVTDTRIDGLSSQIDLKIEKLSREMVLNFNRVSSEMTIQFTDLKSSISEQGSRLGRLESRVDALYSSAATTAAGPLQQLYSPFDLVQVTTKPVQVSDGKYRFAVHLIDMVQANRYTYVVDGNPASDPIFYELTRSAYNSGLGPSAFYLLNEYSRQASNPTALPSYIAEDASFVFRQYDAGYAKTLEQLLGVTPTTTSLQTRPYLWLKLVEELKQNAKSYQVS